jgi:pimeloyl-ACP methyl ester carboxylesterase
VPVKAILIIGVLVALDLGCAGATDVPSPTGQMVDIGGRRLNIHCTGSGAPTVIVENGGAAFSFDWELVQPEVERFARICTYDRAGYAWSDAGQEFDTFDQSVHDLHILLRKAGIAGPYVRVGHSFGGLLVRFYQVTHPSDVVGMVLVDSSHEESFQAVGPKAMRIPELSADQFKTLIDEGKANRPKNRSQISFRRRSFHLTINFPRRIRCFICGR